MTQFVALWTPAGMLLAQMDPSLTLDTSGAAPVLRAAAAATSAVAPPAEKLDVFNPSAAYISVSMSAQATAGELVKVYRNGLLMQSVIDYVIAGQTVTFTAAQGTAPGDVVQVLYR